MTTWSAECFQSGSAPFDHMSLTLADFGSEALLCDCDLVNWELYYQLKQLSWSSWPLTGRFPIEESLNTTGFRELSFPEDWNFKVTSLDISLSDKVWTVACFVLDARVNMSHIMPRLLCPLILQRVNLHSNVAEVLLCCVLLVQLERQLSSEGWLLGGNISEPSQIKSSTWQWRTPITLQESSSH